VFLDFPLFPPVFPPALRILVPDLLRYTFRPSGSGEPDSIEPGSLLFFDLETTGLSTGAGTVAFLAALGRLVEGRTGSGDRTAGNLRLEITQYLLLDHSGEYDFLEAVLAEFAAKPGGYPPLIVSYNGKSFDAQILRSKCIVNGIPPPGFFHADLLHPARRLWKRILPFCSQGEIETAVLGLDRTGDTPGVMAPDIWFNFLKTGETKALKGICDHNVKDIFGLARLFHALAVIAGDPLGVHPVYRYDLENLALHWRKAYRKLEEYALDKEKIQRTGDALLTEAAERGHPRAAFALGRDLFRRGDYEKGRIYLEKAVRENRAPEFYNPAKAAAYRALAIDAERRLKDKTLALRYSEAALDTAYAGSGALPPKLREDLTRRRDRLAGKNAAV
jgi:uncharacterized protein YprB with RNaseH-like and TPR domain